MCIRRILGLEFFRVLAWKMPPRTSETTRSRPGPPTSRSHLACTDIIDCQQHYNTQTMFYLWVSQASQASVTSSSFDVEQEVRSALRMGKRGHCTQQVSEYLCIGSWSTMHNCAHVPEPIQEKLLLPLRSNRSSCRRNQLLPKMSVALQ